MNLTMEELSLAVAATGFGVEPLEKVLRLMALLDSFNSHPFLKSRIALKGGTAINLFYFDVPRLSVDIDLNYIGAADRETMLFERPRMEQAIQAVCLREGLEIKRMPSDHAGGKWRLAYPKPKGGSGNLELDINFMLRTPLWPPISAECRPVGAFRTRPLLVLDPHELAAGKLAALLSRSTCRDIFDSHAILATSGLDIDKLKLGFVVYGAISRKDWRRVRPEDVKADPRAMRHELVPMLRQDLVPARGTESVWVNKLVSECRDRLSTLLPLGYNETEFLRRLNEIGEIVPELLTDNVAMQDTIRRHPALAWKALNVKKHIGSTLSND